MKKDSPLNRPSQVVCPICHAKGDWLGRATAPFCSERCKMVDLGKWLGEEYRLASPLTGEDLLELEDRDDVD